jgi:plastocyanin
MIRAAVAGLLLLILAVPASAQSPKVTIAIQENQFVPAEVQVPAGVKVELVIRNEKKTPAEFESNSLRREKVIPAGSTASVFIGPLNPGRYEFFDEFHPASRGFVVVK